MKRKFFTLFLALVASVGTLFAQSGTCGANLTWSLSDGVLTIRGNGAMDNYNVSAAPWNRYHADIANINIISGVTSIGNLAFRDCYASSVTIPSSVTIIGEQAFDGCWKLASITIPNSVTNIGNYAFNGCVNLVSIIIPNTVTSMGDRTFYNCINLTSVTISNNITNIGVGTFKGCYNLTSVTIPTSVVNIGDYAFSGCSGLTSINIPNSVTDIGKGAFSISTLTDNASAAKSIVIGSSVEYIGDRAFSGHEKVRSITCKATNPPLCSANCFEDINVSIPLYVPGGSINLYKAAPAWKEFYNIQVLNTEAIESIKSDEQQGTKTIKDSQVLILRGDRTYTVTGQELK